jgi:hypothetical protein
MGLFAAIGLPVLLFVGGIAAWRMSRKEGSFEPPEQPLWRDDSLDDWRKERDEQAEQERLQRLQAGTGERLRTGKEEQQESQRQTHTRLGG